MDESILQPTPTSAALRPPLPRGGDRLLGLGFPLDTAGERCDPASSHGAEEAHQDRGFAAIALHKRFSHLFPQQSHHFIGFGFNEKWAVWTNGRTP